MADIFASIFGTGDVSEWSGDNGSTEIDTSNQHHGDYCAYFDDGGDYVYYTLSETELYVRAYIKITQVPYDYSEGFPIFIVRGSGNYICTLLLYGRKVTGAPKFALHRYYPSGKYNWYNVTMNTNDHYCVELYFKKDAADGSFKFWFNGSLVIEETGLNTSGAPTADTVRFGAQWLDGGISGYYGDCFATADSYIGTHEDLDSGFESGDISDFDAAEGSPSVVSDHRHCGIYGLETTVSQYGSEGVYKNIGHHKEFYSQFEVKFLDADPASGDYIEYARFGRSGADLLSLRIKNDGGTVKWGFIYRHAGSDIEAYSATSTNPDDNTWYCIRVHIICSYEDGAAVGVYDMWVDGTNLADIKVTTRDTDYTGITYIYYVATTDDVAGADTYYDCIVAGGDTPEACHEAGSEEPPLITTEETVELQGEGFLQLFRNFDQIEIIDLKVSAESRGVGTVVIPYDTEVAVEDAIVVICDGWRVIEGRINQISPDAKRGVKTLYVRTKTNRLYDKYILTGTHQTYEDEDAGAIVEDLIDYYFNGLFDSDYVDTNTGYVISDADFGEKTVGDALEELSKRASSVFRVDKDNHVWFYVEGDYTHPDKITDKDIIDLKPEIVGEAVKTVIVKGSKGVTGTAGSGIPERTFSDRRITTSAEAQQFAEALLDRYGVSGTETQKKRTAITLQGFWKLRRGYNVVVNSPRRNLKNEVAVIKQIDWTFSRNNIKTELVVGDVENPDIEFVLVESIKKTTQQEINRISEHQGTEISDADPLQLSETILDEATGAPVAVDHTAEFTLQSGTCSSPSGEPMNLALIESEIGRTANGGVTNIHIYVDGSRVHSLAINPDASNTTFKISYLYPANLDGVAVAIKARSAAGGGVSLEADLTVTQYLEHSHSNTEPEAHIFD